MFPMTESPEQRAGAAHESYYPEPVGDGDVRLTDDILRLTERLAVHVHDAWAQGRLDEGWTYGRQRDDEKKTHPGLVPYDELSESEKEYDRTTVRETIRALLALGYRIVPPETTGSAADRDPAR